eukprot:CAMPEP_0194275814 /NCGR_PEP_ID=MMETSP0169-20130528/8566_1 /TAXON_ID=218684 /ORGANISM="Corethron pennatum, Strain L29A3" /LENGTH=93 /DNA_ID=CAMNT_0039019377 /DNA_START=331 /DNA_END=612 /DNA_ORIENTATION=-
MVLKSRPTELKEQLTRTECENLAIKFKGTEKLPSVCGIYGKLRTRPTRKDIDKAFEGSSHRERAEAKKAPGEASHAQLQRRYTRTPDSVTGRV